MNPDLLPQTLSLAFMAIAGAALAALLVLAARRRPLLYLADAAAAAGLVYLFGVRVFGWSFIPREALFAIYAAIFSVAAAVVLTRRARDKEMGFPARAVLVTQGAMAYVFAPPDVWRPFVSLLLAGYFLIEAIGWLRGSEAPVVEAGPKDFRPPFFPPPRLRGLREFALAGLCLAFLYVFAMGTGRAPVAPPPEAPSATPEEAPQDAQTESSDAAPAQAAGPAQAERIYTARAGETLKSIARKLYGKPEKWRALADANPGLKPTKKLRAGQAIKLPEQPI